MSFLEVPDGGYHAFVEFAAKTDMRDCGADTEGKDKISVGEELLKILSCFI